MGFITSIPYLVYFFFINLGGFVADKLQGAKVLSTLNTRRLAMLTGVWLMNKKNKNLPV